MILADTSIWIDYLNSGDERLAGLLADRRVYTHPFVIGEVMLGSLRNRSTVLSLFEDLRSVVRAETAEVLDLVERHKLFGSGIGYVDAHLVASVLLTRPAKLWSRDRRLSAVAARLEIGYEALH